MRCLLFPLLFGLGAAVVFADDDGKATPVSEPTLRSELLRRTKVDQEARSSLIEWMKGSGTNGFVNLSKLTKEQQAEFAKLSAKLKTVDEDNTKWLKGVVEKQGWPGISRVGKDGAHAAWLLVQHADRDLKFQRKCLDLMTALPKHEGAQRDLAYLTDRVLLAEGKKQRYGTQFTQVNGKWKPRPLEDEANVDKRRAEVGLPSLAEYAKLIEKQYGGGEKKK